MKLLRWLTPRQLKLLKRLTLRQLKLLKRLAPRGLKLYSVGLIFAGCSTIPNLTTTKEEGIFSPSVTTSIARPLTSGIQASAPRLQPGAAFLERWRDGKGELSGYQVTTMRYGAPREGQMVLIYVTEPMDRRTWVKDDTGQVPAEHRAEVLKLNHVLKFRTGIYDYSVMTSVFSPYVGESREPFAPAKISLSSQEWCGHVYQQIHPKGDHFVSELHSYFTREGNSVELTPTKPFTLYEDALWIQLRELDGPFNEGRDWTGSLVPSLWWMRKTHRQTGPVPATITRSTATLADGATVTRFVVKHSELTRTFDVEQAAPRRVLGWRSSEGDGAELLKTSRLAYWQLNGSGGEAHLAELGLAL